MFEEDQICPYTGLRSFTEEESLYFKGREEDIDRATEQLQKNKFLMLTGASGDGKSSLIYAGIIPNARAGFLKSKYTQWCVADFRPERTPFDNLCKCIARQLDIANPQTVQTELNHGFSAIIDLYKNSKRHLDTQSFAWQTADDATKAALKREAANLIILVDQFEEFFTNPENYSKGVPSRNATLVLNLLLETSRIALQEDLPVYIVFTMRSDYIGQCAAFRGLPEFIGFSQFFVPRLNRTQLQQVIEEPAVLSGNRITRRLTERLIHDLTEGVDQLPILQHALNQIWHAADNGKEELDLIHYAMVGGMHVSELPEEHIDRFTNWFDGQTPEIKACYHEPNLQNVLDTHTNKLYERASDYYAEITGKTISEEDARTIIKTTFICLTKIDQSRAVRNRMTLKEITNIIGKPEYGTGEVGSVLDIFREPGNTFLRPFIFDDVETKVLHENDILDITHESLIRNWAYLEQWAKEEYTNYAISLDFEQQLNRWVDSGKSNNFLLSIGPLTYFENWFKSTNPNAHWIARYLPEDSDQDKKLTTAKKVLSNAKEFISRSAKKFTITRTIMRYGPKRIAAIFALIALLTLSSFAVKDYFQKQNDYVLKNIKKQSFELSNLPKLSPEFPIPVITSQLIIGNVTIPEVIDAIKEKKQKIKIATGIASQLIVQGRYEPKKEILQSLSIADSLLEKMVIPRNNRELSEGLKSLYDFSVTAGFGYYFNHDKNIKSFVTNNAIRSSRWALQILKQQPDGFTDIQNLSLAITNAINYKIFTVEEIKLLLEILSPFENKSPSPWVQNNYKRENFLTRGSFKYKMHFNGLYQDLAYLYAALGNSEKALQCVDSILFYQDGFFQNDYTMYVENAGNIAGVFYTYGTTQSLDDFVQRYCKHKNISTVEFYNRLVSRSLMNVVAFSNINFYAGGGGQVISNLNLSFQNDSSLTFFFSKLNQEILKIKDNDERNFNLAVAIKNEGLQLAYRKEIQGIIETKTDLYYERAFQYFNTVSKEYLEQSISVNGVSSADIMTVPRKFLFLYPDYRVPFHPFEPRGNVEFYTSSAFLNYVIDQNLFDKLYKNSDELKYFELWLFDYQVLMSSRDLFLHDQMPVNVMEKLALKLEQRKANQSIDLNTLYLQLSDNAFKNNNREKGINYLNKIQIEKLQNGFQTKTYDFINNYFLELIGNAMAEFIVNNNFDFAYQMLNVFKKGLNRSSIYAFASQKVILNNPKNKNEAQRLLDSSIVEMKRLDNPGFFQPNRHQIAIALMYIDPDKNSTEAYKTIKNNGDKFGAITRFSRAYATYGNLYQAQQQTPQLISAADKSFFLRNILEGFYHVNTKKDEWSKFNDNQLIFSRNPPVFLNEND